MSRSKFHVSQYRNSTGSMAWRVEGRINGIRFRRNLKTKEEAAAEKAALELEAGRGDSNLRAIPTSLSEAQAREAEAAFHRLNGRTRSLTFYLDYALANYRDPVQEKSVTDAAKEYLALRNADHNQGHLSHRQFTSFRCELRALQTLYPKQSVAEITPAALAEFFKRGQASKKTYNNRRGLVGAFFKYCVLQDWLGASPTDKVPFYRGIGHRRGSAPSLTATQCAEIMEWAETNHDGALVPFIALCLFAGIRPDLYQGEISKLQAKDVRLDTGVILIEPEVSKVRMKRAITIQPNLGTWLRTYPLEDFPIMPRGFRRLRLKFRKQFDPSHDVLRHTFISMFVAKFRSLGDAALQAGNSESIIRKHYLDLKSPAEAEEFFRIVPKHAPAGAAQPANVVQPPEFANRRAKPAA